MAPSALPINRPCRTKPPTCYTNEPEAWGPTGSHRPQGGGSYQQACCQATIAATVTAATAAAATAANATARPAASTSNVAPTPSRPTHCAHTHHTSHHNRRINQRPAVCCMQHAAPQVGGGRVASASKAQHSTAQQLTVPRPATCRTARSPRPGTRCPQSSVCCWEEGGGERELQQWWVQESCRWQQQTCG